MVELPSGTVTFLFTDIEGSTRLWEEHPGSMPAALAQHDSMLRTAIENAGGSVVKTTGDGCMAAFSTADAGVSAAVAAQRALDAASWGDTGQLRVRMGLHTGVASRRDGDYFGSSLNRAARLMGVAHGGQVVCSQATTDLARDALAEGIEFVDLGEHRLRDLTRAERIYQVSAEGLGSRFAALASVDSFPGNLPLQVSSFVGRAREISETIAALDEARVVTLTGVGGVGKTRLALQVAAEVVPRFREGAWLVELGPVRDSEGVVDAVAAVFRVSPHAGEQLIDALVEFLGSKQLLLLVDNCEHVLDPVAELVEKIGQRCPSVAVLATSREGLAIGGERILAVPSLRAPASGAELEAVEESEAVQLFVERAQAVDAAFRVGSENVEAVTRVSRRLDGVPLALELAAAQLGVMSARELAAALDHRFEVLAGGRRGAVKRQQTLRATIDWSYDLLEEPQRRLLARLAVFAGGCTRDAAEEICAGQPIEARHVLELLGDLVRRSLVDAERNALGTRYRLLETIREYAEERLVEHDETDRLRERFARHYADYARHCYEELAGPEQLEWGTRLTADYDNILAAFNHAIDTRDLDLAVGFLESTTIMGIEGAGYVLNLPVEPVLDIPGVALHPAYPVVLMAAAFAAEAHGEAGVAQHYGDAALDAERALSAPRAYVADLDSVRHQLAGLIGFDTGDWDAAATSFLEAAERSRRAGRQSVAASNLSGAGSALCYAGRFAEAGPIAAEALELARTTGAPATIMGALVTLAQALSHQDPERSRSLLDEASLTHLDQASMVTLTQMTLAAAMIADWPLTARLGTRAIPELRWVDHRPYLQATLTAAARSLANADPEAAATIQGAAYALARSTTTTAASNAEGTADAGSAGHRSGLTLELRRDATRLLRERLGEPRLRALRDQGAAMDIDRAVAYTLAHLDGFLHQGQDGHELETHS